MATNPKPDGGPAFPGFQYTEGHGNYRRVTPPDGNTDWEVFHPGMTLRDQAALTVLSQIYDKSSSADIACREAYQVADEFIKARGT